MGNQEQAGAIHVAVQEKLKAEQRMEIRLQGVETALRALSGASAMAGKSHQASEGAESGFIGMLEKVKSDLHLDEHEDYHKKESATLDKDDADVSTDRAAMQEELAAPDECHEALEKQRANKQEGYAVRKESRGAETAGLASEDRKATGLCGRSLRRHPSEPEREPFSAGGSSGPVTSAAAEEETVRKKAAEAEATRNKAVEEEAARRTAAKEEAARVATEKAVEEERRRHEAEAAAHRSTAADSASSELLDDKALEDREREARRVYDAGMAEIREKRAARAKAAASRRAVLLQLGPSEHP